MAMMTWPTKHNKTKAKQINLLDQRTPHYWVRQEKSTCQFINTTISSEIHLEILQMSSKCIGREQERPKKVKEYPNSFWMSDL